MIEFDRTGVKSAEEINELIKALTKTCLNEIRNEVSPIHRYVNDEASASELDEEIDEIVRSNVLYGIGGGLGQPHHVATDDDDMFFYASILEHQSWSSYHDAEELFEGSASGWSSHDTRAAREAMTALYAEVKRRVDNTLEKKLEMTDK